MIDKDEIVEIILQCIEDINNENAIDIAKDVNTKLFGSDSELDSILLVNLIVAVEESIEELSGKYIPIAFESELLLCDYIFNELNMHKINGDVMEDNKDMIKFRKYLGYSFDGVLRDQYIINNEFKSTLLVSVLESEYLNKCRNRLLGLIKISRL